MVETHVDFEKSHPGLMLESPGVSAVEVDARCGDVFVGSEVVPSTVTLLLDGKDVLPQHLRFFSGEIKPGRFGWRVEVFGQTRLLAANPMVITAGTRRPITEDIVLQLGVDVRLNVKLRPMGEATECSRSTNPPRGWCQDSVDYDLLGRTDDAPPGTLFWRRPGEARG